MMYLNHMRLFREGRTKSTIMRKDNIIAYSVMYCIEVSKVLISDLQLRSKPERRRLLFQIEPILRNTLYYNASRQAHRYPKTDMDTRRHEDI